MKEYKGKLIINKQKIKYFLMGAVFGGGLMTIIFYPQIQILKEYRSGIELL